MTEERLSVLIVGYLRFENLLKILECCVNNKIEKVYISLDGAKDESSSLLQSAAIEKILKYSNENNLELLVRHRNTNAGVAVAIIEGISWFFKNEDFGIILEDDLEVSPSFFQFIADAKLLRQSHPTIAAISGNNYFAELESSAISATHYPLIWGWATWRSEWEGFLEYLNSPLRNFFNYKNSLKVNFFWLTATLQSRFGFVDSWAMSFAHYIRTRDMICLLPPVNLVSNVGSDSVAVHSVESDGFVRFPVSKLAPNLNWMVPNESEIQIMDARLESFIFRISHRHIFSPFKLAIRMFKWRPRKSLVNRLAASRLKMDFSVISGG